MWLTSTEKYDKFVLFSLIFFYFYQISRELVKQICPDNNSLKLDKFVLAFEFFPLMSGELETFILLFWIFVFLFNFPKVRKICPFSIFFIKVPKNWENLSYFYCFFLLFHKIFLRVDQICPFPFFFSFF